MNDLEMYREQLALCDDKIIDALVERSSIIEKIMAYKEEYGMPILQPHQEEKQKRRLEEKLKENKYKEEIFDVFGCILRNSKRIQARKLFDYNIVLIGFMGAGKSTISDYLSTMFDMDIVEMDQVIAEREEMSIPDIFATYGEEYFRDLETNLLIEMQSHKNAVISCGGGAALREKNVAEMKKNGRVVLLTATPETIFERVKDSNDRPVLNGRKNVKGISELMEQRREKSIRMIRPFFRSVKSWYSVCRSQKNNMFDRFFPDQYVASTYVIDFEKLYEEGVRGLIFDIDNTLVPHGAPADERAKALFARLKAIGFRCCLISNNQKPRVEMFNKDIQVDYVYNAHKPSTRNYLRAMEIMGTDRRSSVFIGDQLFTDVWGAKRAGIPNILVKPIHPKEEIQIVLKRYLEKIVLHFYKKSQRHEKKVEK